MMCTCNQNNHTCIKKVLYINRQSPCVYIKYFSNQKEDPCDLEKITIILGKEGVWVGKYLLF